MSLEEEARILSMGASAPRAKPRTIAFVGKGGVGKSVVALNAAILLAKRGERVVILDGDLGLASINVLLGLSPHYDLRHVLAGERRLRDIVLHGPHGLTIVPAGSGIAELANLDKADLETLLGQLEELKETADYLLIDTGAGISDTVLNLVAFSDETIVVTRAEPTALADAYALIKVIVQQMPSYPFHLLLNMVRDGAQAEQVFQSLAAILVRFLGYQPGYAGFVIDDPCVGESVVKQVPFVLGDPRSQATRCLSAFVEKLAPASKIESQGAPPRWRRMLSRLW